MTDAILAGAVLAAMAGLALHDARRALVDPRMVVALLGAAAAWRFAGPGGAEGAWPRLAAGVLGAALGVAAVMIPIGVAAWLGRRWPLYPGDAMMLGAFGFLLGVPGLAWTMLVGCALALLHRFCVQRKRGRPFRKGLVPLGPGMCTGAAAVFLCMNFGVALAGDTGAADTRAADTRAADTRAVDPRALDARDVTVAPLPAVSDGDKVLRLPATELAPVPAGLPPSMAGRVVSVEESASLPFPALLRRLSALAGVAMRIEERPARIAGGAAILEDAPPLRLAWNGSLARLLDRVAWLSGYDWSWQTLGPETRAPETLGPETRVPETPVPETHGPRGGVVFHRYWDIAQRGPAPDGSTEIVRSREAAEDGASAAPGSDGGWTVDPEQHRTLRGVLESWAARAGWTLVWNAGRDYGLGAAATRPPEIVRVRYPAAARAPEAVEDRDPLSEPVRESQTAASILRPEGLWPKGLPHIPAGTGLYARTMYAVDSDYPGPVLLEILEPPLAGAVASGAFTLIGERLVLRLGRLEYRGRSLAVDAWAAGLDCACYGVDGDVDSHWFERVLLPSAVRFAEGFLSALSRPSETVVFGDELRYERRGSETREAVHAGLATAARTAGDVLLENAPDGPSVRIARDTELVVVFAAPPGSEDRPDG